MSFAAFGAPLFLMPNLPLLQLAQIVNGIRIAPAADRIELAPGEPARRELSIPFLAGMDRVKVDAAALRLRAGSHVLESHAHSVKNGSGNDAGVILDLGTAGRVDSVELGPITFPSAVTGSTTRFTYRGIETRSGGTETKSLRLVVRPAAPIGPPAFSDPDFSPPGPLFGRVLSGLSVTVNVATKTLVVRFPGTTGRAWLFQLAHGDEVTELTPIAFNAPIGRVTLDAAPTALAVSLAAASGDVVLFNHPGELPRDPYVQEIRFTPLAERELAEKLAEPSPSPTLPLSLRFQSESQGAVEVVGTELTAHYEADPLGSAPAPTPLRGRWTALELAVPPGRKPFVVSARFGLKHLGRELNGPEPEPDAPSPRGLRIAAERWTATALTWESPSGGAAADLPLASASVHLSAPSAAEVVLELRADAAGLPGSAIAPALVQKLAPRTRGWIDFQLPTGLPFMTGRRLWLALRATQGEVFWSSGSARPALVSRNRGSTWAPPETALADLDGPLAQLFHSTSAPSVPVVRVRSDPNAEASNLFGSVSALAPGEYEATALALPKALFDAASAPGTARRTLSVLLFSRAVLDLSARALTFSYHPFPEV